MPKQSATDNFSISGNKQNRTDYVRAQLVGEEQQDFLTKEVPDWSKTKSQTRFIRTLTKSPLVETPCEKHIKWLAPRPAFEELYQAWLSDAIAQSKSYHTIHLVRSALTYYLTYLHMLGISDDPKGVTPWLMRSYMVYLRNKTSLKSMDQQHHRLSSHTVRNYCSGLSSFFNWLAIERFINVSPFEHIKLPKVRQNVVKAYSANELESLLKAVDLLSKNGHRDLCILMMILDTAIRSEEMTNIKVGDVDITHGFLKVFSKTREARQIPIGHELVKGLRSYMSFYRTMPENLTEDYLFISDQRNKLDVDAVRLIVKKYSIKAGIGKVGCSPCVLRQSAAVAFLQNGGSVFALQKLLGQSTLYMTRKYCRAADQGLKRAHQFASPMDNLYSNITAQRSTNLETQFPVRRRR